MAKVSNKIDKTKGISDKKVYRYVTLENGLECLLISSRFARDTKVETRLSIINDRRISARHSSVAFVRETSAKEYLLGNETTEMFSNRDNDKKPVALPAFRKSINVSRKRPSIHNHSQRLSVAKRSRHSLHNSKEVVAPSNLSKIELFSSLKPLAPHVPDEVANSSPKNAKLRYSKSPIASRRSFKPSTKSISIPGHISIDVESVHGPVNNRARMAAVSLAVAAGSFSEPREYHGLAHFLEHLLFMGTKEFPEENYFDQFLSRVGGSSNAYTDSERTVYHFNCPQENLPEALNIFSKFFVNPLLVPERGMRELESIEEEFKLRKNDDECRSLELWRYTAREDTPFSKFTCGNIDTLMPVNNDLSIFEALKLFKEKYYVGQNMRLVIQSGNNVSALEKTVLKHFSDIRSAVDVKTAVVCPRFKPKGLPWRIGIPTVAKRLENEFKDGIWPELLRHDKDRLETEYLNPGEDGASLGCVFRNIPLQDMNKLVLLWQLPPQCDYKDSRPTDYIVSLIGHNCQGSVFSETRRRGWVTSLTASCCTTDGFEDNSVVTLLKISIVLTKTGFEQWTFVAGMVFEYIGMLQREPLRKWVFDEAMQIYRASYDYAEEADAQSRVQELSVCLLPQWGYTPDNLLDMGLHKELKWDPDTIKFILNQLRPELVRVDLSSPLYKHKVGATYQGNMMNKVDKKTSLMSQDGKKLKKGSFVATMKFSAFKRRLVKLSSRGKNTLTEIEDEAQNLLVMNKPIKRYPEVEPFTQMAYWVDRIPSSVMSFWVELLEGKSGVITKNEAESDAGSGINFEYENEMTRLRYPPRNEFIAFDFSLRRPLRDYSKHEQAKYLLGHEVRISHQQDTNPAPRTSAIGSSSLSEFMKGTITYVDIKKLLIVVEYTNGLRRWHRLPSDFFETHEELLKAEFDKDVNGSKRSIREIQPSETANKVIELMLDEKFATRLSLMSPLSSRFSGLVVENSELKVRRKMLKGFPVISPKERNKVPVLLPESNALLSVWHFQDEDYKFPRAEIRCRIVNPLCDENSFNSTLNDLLSFFVTEAIRSDIYLAQIAELEIFLKPFEHGQTFSIYGFSHKVQNALDKVMSCFVRFALCGTELAELQKELEALGKTKHGRRYRLHEEKLLKLKEKTENVLFEIIESPVFYAQVEALTQNYCNEGTQFQSSGVLSSAMYRVLVKNTIAPEAKALITDSIEPSYLAVFAAKFLKRCRMEILIAGNISYVEANDILSSVKKHLNKVTSNWLPASDVPKFRMIKVPKSKVIASMDPWHALSGLIHPLEALEFKGHSVDLYFHVGKKTLHSRVVLDMIEHLMREPLYREVRTKQQLGYMVKCSSVDLYGQLGFVIELTSGKHLPQELAQDVDNFLLLFRNSLREMPQDIFFENITALARRKLELKGFSHAVDQHWETILQSYDSAKAKYHWSSLFAEIDFLRDTMTKDLLLSRFDEWLLPTSIHRKRVSVVVFGNGHGINPLKELLARKNYIKIVNGLEYDEMHTNSTSTGPICSIM